MNKHDQMIQELTRTAEKWKKLAEEAAQRACEECDEYNHGSREKYCVNCRMERIRKEAAKPFSEEEKKKIMEAVKDYGAETVRRIAEEQKKMGGGK